MAYYVLDKFIWQILESLKANFPLYLRSDRFLQNLSCHTTLSLSLLVQNLKFISVPRFLLVPTF